MTKIVGTRKTTKRGEIEVTAADTNDSEEEKEKSMRSRGGSIAGT